MRLLIGFFCLIISVFAGYMCAEKYVLRARFYKDYLSFAEKIRNEVLFANNTLLSIINDFTQKSDFYDCVKVYLTEKKFEFKKTYISEEEKNELRTFILEIGKSDKNSQIRFLDGVINNLEKTNQIVTSDEKKYKTLNLKLGLLIGIIIFIIVI